MILAFALCALLCPSPSLAAPDVEPLLDAIRLVETGSEPNGGRDAIGDEGRSIGPYQIQRAYWLDSGVAGRYESCRDPEYARRVVRAYWRRYCPDALDRGDYEVLARVHNGGARGHRKEYTLPYWSKVERELARRS
jgi:hypothetical protein